MSKRIFVASVLSFTVCAVSAQAELLIGAQYIGQFFNASSQNEKREKKLAEQKAIAEKNKLLQEEAREKNTLIREASKSAALEAEAGKKVRYEELEKKFKEDKFQLELAHVKTLNKHGKNGGAVAEENVIYRHKVQTLNDEYHKDRSIADAKSRELARELEEQYRAKAMADLNKKYHPATDTATTVEVSEPSN